MNALHASKISASPISFSHVYVIPVFVWVLTFFIVFALQIIQPIVSILTFAKGSLLLATVSVYKYISQLYSSFALVTGQSEPSFTNLRLANLEVLYKNISQAVRVIL